MADVSLAAYRFFGCRDAARLDFREDQHGNVKLLEVNTIPGLHPTHSTLPVIVGRAGIPYGALIDTIVCSAFSRAL